ncbi:MAG: hypothetical protein ACPG4T_22050 [Nannocystaceae bacterium]
MEAVLSTLAFVDLVVVAPFSGLFLLAYILVVLRRSCLPGMPWVALLNVAGGLLLATTDLTLGVAQVAVFVLGFLIDRVIRRAVARVDAENTQAQIASGSYLAIPSMAPVPTTDIRDSTISAQHPIEDDGSGSSSESNSSFV